MAGPASFPGALVEGATGQVIADHVIPGVLTRPRLRSPLGFAGEGWGGLVLGRCPGFLRRVLSVRGSQTSTGVGRGASGLLLLPTRAAGVTDRRHGHLSTRPGFLHRASSGWGSQTGVGGLRCRAWLPPPRLERMGVTADASEA